MSLSDKANTLFYWCRARLACVSRAFRRCCTQHASCMRQHTELKVPLKGWEAYVEGVSRCLASHATALRTVQIRIKVRRSLLCSHSTLLHGRH